MVTERRLAALVASLLEPAQRVAVFGRAMESLLPTDAAALFQALLERAVRARDRESKILSETALLCLLRAQWNAIHLEATRGAAADAGFDLATLLLANVSDSAEPSRSTEPVPNYTGDERPLTLGERRAIARKQDRQILSRAMVDPHPMVIARVLENPRVSESDVIYMASRRRASPAVLREIATHEKWRLNRRVAFSLLCNPALPMGLCLSLLPNLDPPRLLDIVSDGASAGLVRHVAAALLELREKSCQHSVKTTDT
ncbi:MAG: hypothetical protein MUC50_06260 [Myxococcota bacterium]|nr:hypothetical protein [Myxococcota bacterium]